MPLPPPPALPLTVIREFVAGHFGLTGDYARLDGERDQNHRLVTATGAYVVKVMSPAEGLALAEAQADALRHIAETAPAIPVPRCHAATSGAVVPVLRHEGQDHPVLVLDWLDGEVIAESRLTPGQYRAWGEVIGRLNHALRGFTSAFIMSRKLDWNTARFSETGFRLDHVPAEAAKLISPVIAEFERDVAAKLRHVPHQVIHGDVHPYNTLRAPSGAISGIIDFGDMIHGARLLDLSNAIGDCLVPGHDFASAIEGLVSGFTAHVPLEDAEIALLLPLAKMRLVISYLVSLSRKDADGAVTPQIAALAAISLDVLRALQARDMSDVVLRAAGRDSPQSGGGGDAEMMRRRIAAMGPKPLLFYRKPLHMVRGEGMWLIAGDGRRYLDCYNNVAHVGHAHPVVADAISRQLRILNTNTRYLTDQSVEYAERLKATLDPALDTVIFVNSGSEANDVAWRMANAVTGRRGALCMDNAYHGVTMMTDMLSPSNYPPGKWNMPLVRQMPAPDRYRGPIGHDHPDAAGAYAAMIDPLITDLDGAGHGVSIGIVDSAFMTNGFVDAPAGYVQQVVDRVHRAGGLFIADEVQSGFGRMGTHMWGHQHHGVVPDFVTIGKPAGNGYPVGVVITRADILDRFTAETGPFFSTFGGGNAACAAGLAVLDVMERERLQANSLATGQHLRTGLRKLMERFDILGDVRGSGLAIGVEFVRDRRSREPAAAETTEAVNRLKDEGVLVGTDGKLGNVMKIRPPLALSLDQADLVLAALARVLAAMQ
ncbi:MAG: aminotransferase class III-fold pyridoxal phosphate-dependent enzyme [Rhizobiales bacterium]|nr:aminotransferase class III-fold pyridoxal phosphate-dependent enzyme [Hyphomicrobiales bacterium]